MPCSWIESPGFEEYIDAYRRDFLIRGGLPKYAAEPEFRQDARRGWEDE
jgi:hypothetical protein